MKNPRLLMEIRKKKLGVLLYDSRIALRRSIDECAAALGIPADVYQSFENGSASPSLPQIELLSLYFNIPLEHFWSRQALTNAAAEIETGDHDRIFTLRNRVIGATLKLARSAKNLSLSDLSVQSAIPADQLQKYETGELPIPLPELEVLAALVETPLANYYDQHGPIGRKREQQGKTQTFLDLPPELQAFVTKPVNRPYLEIALRLSDLPAEKLRTLAESLLEITY